MKKNQVGLKRDTIDKYYTNSITVELCLKKIKEYININEHDIIIEPSAGNGAFINGIKEMCNNTFFFEVLEFFLLSFCCWKKIRERRIGFVEKEHLVSLYRVLLG